MLLMPPGMQTKPMANEVRALVGKSALRRGWLVAIPYLDKERTVFYLGAQKRLPSLLEALQEEFAIPSEKTIAVGVSNGGITALAFAAAYPGEVQAVVGTPGMFPPRLPLKNIKHLRDMPIYLRVGGKDSPIWQGFETIQALEKVSADLNAGFKKEGHGLRINYDQVLAWTEERVFGPRSRVPKSVKDALAELNEHDAESSKNLTPPNQKTSKARITKARPKSATN